MKNKFLAGITALYMMFGSCTYSQNNPNNLNEKNLESKVAYEDSFTVSIQKKNSQRITWKEIDRGLYFTEFMPQKKSDLGNSKITILKINPKYYNFNLISSKENNERNKTAKEWAESGGLLAVINAGMYQGDHKTNTGFMKNYEYINNSKINENGYNAVVAFNRKDKKIPEFQIIDLKCQNWNELKEKYNSYSQGIRMIDCNQINKWAQQDKKWSISAIGKDKEGNALFIFTRSPYSVHDFIDILLKSPLNIHNAMYLEGGPEASFHLNHNGAEIEKFGSYETNFYESDDNPRPWEIPNIIGIKKK